MLMLIFIVNVTIDKLLLAYLLSVKFEFICILYCIVFKALSYRRRGEPDVLPKWVFSLFLSSLSSLSSSFLVFA